MNTDIRAERPTTEGIIATLSTYDLRGRTVGVQLYPDMPNTILIDFLGGAGAIPIPVLPYAYALKADDTRVIELMDEISSGRVDVVAFTSSPQVRRHFNVAE